MKAAIFFSGKFGSTKQYSQWLSEATGIPVINSNITGSGNIVDSN